MISLRVFIVTWFLSCNCRAVFHTKNNFPLRPQFVYKMNRRGWGRGMLAANIHLGGEQEGHDKICSPNLLRSSFLASCNPNTVEVQ